MISKYRSTDKEHALAQLYAYKHHITMGFDVYNEQKIVIVDSAEE